MLLTVSLKGYAFVFAVLLLRGGLEAQPETYFPHRLGDTWKYFVYDGIQNDTLEVRVIFDSTDPMGSSHVKHQRQLLNPARSPWFAWYDRFIIDTSLQVLGTGFLPPNSLVYRLNASVGQWWIVHSSGGSGGDVAKVLAEYPDTIFGRPTTIKTIGYYGASDTSDTTVWLEQYADIVAEGFGTVFRGGGKLGYNLYLMGCVVNGNVYGDTILVSVSEPIQNKLPSEFTLCQNYPNPFNPSTTIKYDLPEPGKVSLVVYDVLGRKVADLVNEQKPAGYHSITWNAVNVASGVYLARFTAFDANGFSKYSRVGKLILMK